MMPNETQVFYMHNFKRGIAGMKLHAKASRKFRFQSFFGYVLKNLYEEDNTSINKLQEEVSGEKELIKQNHLDKSSE